MLKKFIKKILNYLGIEISRYNPDLKYENIFLTIKKILPKKPLIIDVGANEGQSIDNFKKIFKYPNIHSFEPVETSFLRIKNKYSKDKNIIFNNIALGEKKGLKYFHIFENTGLSSFVKMNFRSKFFYSKKKILNHKKKITIDKLDNYIKKIKLKNIDLLKIDTQGYEDKVLQGALYTIKRGLIGAVLLEIMFDNYYCKYFSFSDIEKFLKPSKFRMVAIHLTNNNLFTGKAFFADVLYLNKDKYNI